MPDRGSSKHSQWRDDEMAREVESLTTGSPAEARADESRLAEPPGEGEPEPGVLHGRPDVAPAGPLTPDEVEARSLLAGWLRPSIFPATRDALLRSARAEGAEEWALTLLGALPADVEYANVQRVWEATGGEREERHAPPPPAAEPPAVPATTAPAEEAAAEPAVTPARREPEVAPPGKPPRQEVVAEAAPSLPARVLGLAGEVISTAFRIGSAPLRFVRRRLPL